MRFTMIKEKEHFLGKLFPAIALASVCCILWGSAFPCVKIGYSMFNIVPSNIPDIWVYAGIRFTIAGLLVILFEALQKRRITYPKSSASLKRVFILALFQTVGQYSLYYIGLANTPGVKASILNGTGVIVLLFVAAFIFRQEKLTAKKLIAGLIGFSGILLMNIKGGADYGSFKFIGEGFLLLSILSSGVSTCFIKQFSKHDDPVILSGFQFTTGGLMLVVMGLAIGGSVAPTGFTAWLMMIYQSLISAVAYTLWSVLLKHNPVSRIAVCKFMVPVFGVILSALFLGEPITLMCIAALLLVAVSVFVVNK